MTKIVYLVLINLVTPKARAKHEPLVQQTGHCFNKVTDWEKQNNSFNYCRQPTRVLKCQKNYLINFLISLYFFLLIVKNLRPRLIVRSMLGQYWIHIYIIPSYFHLCTCRYQYIHTYSNTQLTYTLSKKHTKQIFIHSCNQSTYLLLGSYSPIYIHTYE